MVWWIGIGRRAFCPWWRLYAFRAPVNSELAPVRLGEMFKRKKRPRDEGLYIHLAADGAVFIVRWNGEQLWTDREGLRGELAMAKAAGATILYSRENPETEPGQEIVETFKLIPEAGLPIKLLKDPHPEALVPAGERRTILRKN